MRKLQSTLQNLLFRPSNELVNIRTGRGIRERLPVANRMNPGTALYNLHDLSAMLRLGNNWTGHFGPSYGYEF
jgi:hypothetical protein